MDEGLSPFSARIQASQAAIGRIRAARAAGTTDADQVAEDWNLIRSTAAPTFTRFARSLDWLGPLAAEEALEAIEERLVIDVCSTTFPSLETGFGVYIKQMPPHITEAIRRKNMVNGALSPIERLDAPVGDDGILLHETVGDPQASANIDAVADREAIQATLAQLPVMQRQAFLLRTSGASNNEVADQLGVSAATATRLYQRALEQLKHYLRDREE